MKTSSPVVAAAVVLSIGACTTEQVTENTGDAVVGVGRLAVNTAIGATRLAYRGARGTYRAVRDARSPEGEPFPPAHFCAPWAMVSSSRPSAGATASTAATT